jgi:uncharacterized membrane protein YgcG
MRTHIRQRRRIGRGQAIVLGSIGLFIMVLGVISTLNIGQAVSERIRLQNAADAAAYSLAAEEARLFNFFAFTNRAQVAHYSAAMTIQSYISYLTYVGGLEGSLRDLIWDAASIYQCICDLNIDYPPISPPYCIAAEAMALVGDLLAIMVRLIEEGLNLADGQAADLVEAMHLLNRAIWRAQLQQGLMINLLLTSGAYPYVEANDPAVDFGLVNGFNALFNQLEFNQVFDRGAGMNFSLFGIIGHPEDIWSPRIHDEENDDEDVETARQVMTEIANASRWGPGSSASDTFVTDRRRTLPIPSLVGVANFLPPTHHGQTRMVSGDGGGGGGFGGGFGGGGGSHEVEMALGIEEIRADDDGSPEYYTGTVIASDDYLEPIGWVGGTIFYMRTSEHIGAAVIADSEGGGHYGYEHTDDVAWSSGLMRLPPDIPRLLSVNVLELACAMACCSETEETFPDDTSDDYSDHDEGIHQWDGITAYPKFNPSPDETRDYNQPSTWILLNLPPENFNRFGSREGHRPWSMDFSMTFGSRTVSLDTTPGTGDSAPLSFMRGLNVISRGQAYYHRPRPAGGDGRSNWQEHPNFFNPFWRARLAPVGQKLTQVYNRLVSRELHAEPGSSPVLAGGLNLVRNFMGDVFFHTVTSLMTH